MVDLFGSDTAGLHLYGSWSQMDNTICQLFFKHSCHAALRHIHIAVNWTEKWIKKWRGSLQFWTYSESGQSQQCERGLNEMAC